MNGLTTVVDGGVAMLTLDRPEARNALTPALIGELVRALEDVGGGGDIRAVVMRGAGEAFCAGYDLNHMTSPGTGQAGRERDDAERICSALGALPMPTIAAVSGVASGAGCDIAMSCDVRFAADDARFAVPPARLGILYSPAGIERLTGLVGAAVAKELLFTGALIDARRALAVGLVNRVVPAALLDDEVAAFVAEILGNARLSVEASKLIVDGAPADQIAEAELRVWRSADASEGARAFRERRAPRFLGR